ncbi:fimbrial protein YehD [Citrobacter sedlakii]
MNNSIIAAAVLSGIFMSAGAFAANEDMGELKIKGEIVGTSCTFEGENNATIELSQVGADRLTGLNAGDVYSGYTSPEVSLQVKCADNNNPRISFNPSQFVDGLKVTRNNADDNGAGFAVYLNGSQVKPDKAGNFLLNKDDAVNGVYTMKFFARYAAVTTNVTPGPVESVLTMTVLTD